jgi:cytochrome c-type biogenesis protein CcmH
MDERHALRGGVHGRGRRFAAFAWVLALLAMFCMAPAIAKDAEPVAVNPQLEARMMALATELRCLVCQNQTIADSHADLAADLRQQIRDMLARGQDEDEIRRYMTDRYGDFVLYKPPLKPTTVLLWAGPPLLLLAALAALFVVLRRRQRAGADAFDPETPESPEDASPYGATR